MNHPFKQFVIYATAATSVIFSADAATTGFVNNPTTNSSDWSTYVIGQGATIKSNVNFDSHPTGLLLTNFYLLSDGVSLLPSGDVTNVTFGSGPGQGNTTSPPLSTGEGLHPASNYLEDGSGASSLTISFTTPVLGAGLYVVDYFDPNTSESLTIDAYTGANGTGSLLGSFSAVSFNFQPNNMYFMGVASDAANIGSIVFSDFNGGSGDVMGIDNIVFATGQTSSVPDAGSSFALLGLAMSGMAFLRRKIMN
jgi:hypothetical protein